VGSFLVVVGWVGPAGEAGSDTGSGGGGVTVGIDRGEASTVGLLTLTTPIKGWGGE